MTERPKVVTHRSLRSAPYPLTPPRRFVFRIDFARELEGAQFSGDSPVQLLEAVGSLTAAYRFIPPAPFNGRNVSGMAQVYKYLAIGLTYMQTTGYFGADVDASLPSSLPNGEVRTAMTSVTGLTRTQEHWHVELAARYGNESAELTLFTGPSFMKVTQELIEGLAVREFADKSAVITRVFSAPFVGGPAVGFNVGGDVSWFMAPKLGIGLGLRYSRAETSVRVDQGRTRVVSGGVQGSVGARLGL
jgi:hypothetical protein